MKTRLEEYKKIVETHQRHAPISELIDMRMTAIEKGQAIFELDVKNEFLNSINTMQGGVISIMADAAMGIAFGSVLDTDTKFSTIEFKINFFRPVTHGHLVAVGEVKYRGKKIGYTACEILNSENKLIANAVGTCIILR
ncbi:MAG: hotdog fold thioesterase [Candidatus Lokiarchaeota archaeon]|nr:hotdog fold thioesterase [Candidatus Lokiarchaeota archaeon]